MAVVPWYDRRRAAITLDLRRFHEPSVLDVIESAQDRSWWCTMRAPVEI